MTPWQALGVNQDIGVADLRRRYAALIKEFRPETHPQDFARIREAYEVALPFARHRELTAAQETPVSVEESLGDVRAVPDEPAEDAAPAPSADPFPLVIDATPLSIDDALAIDDDAIGLLPDTPETTVEDEEPELAARFRRFHALAASAVGTRDEAFLPELRALLQARAHATLDDSQALEFALMRWFIEAPTPPLTLLFETGRSFDWHSHIVRLSSWLSPWALRHMEARLAMSRDLVFARHFSGNAWLRRLHSPRTTLTPFASRAATIEASSWARRWEQASEDADAAALASSLNSRVQRRLGGRQLLTTDLLMGLVLAGTASDLGEAALYAVVGTAIVFALRLALMWIRPAPGHYRLPQAVGNNLGIAFVLVIGLAGAGAAMFAAPDVGDVTVAIAGMMIAPATLLGLAMAWNGLSWLERGVAEAFSWRDAVDRLEFDRLVNGRAATDAAAPFGSRLGLVARMKAIPEALRFRTVEIALRARPARPLLLRRFSYRGRQTSVPRMLWFGAWALFAILRLVHAIGH